MKKIYDKRFVHFEWDDMLEGKRCVVSDLVSDIRQYVNSTTDTLALLEVKNSGDHNYPFSTGTNCHLFCYYDPLLEYKLAFNVGKKVEYNDGDGWYPVYDSFYWDDEYRYRITKEEAKPERLTKRQLSQWLAQGNGEIMCDGGDTMSVAFIYPLGEENEEVTGQFLVRRWEDTEWHEPTVGYCFPETGEKNE